MSLEFISLEKSGIAHQYGYWAVFGILLENRHSSGETVTLVGGFLAGGSIELLACSQ